MNKSNSIKPIKLNPDNIFDLETNEYSSPYKKINQDEYKSYINNNLKNKLLNYENELKPEFDEIYELSKKSFAKFLDKNLINNINLTTDIFIKINAKGIKLNKNGTLSVIKSNEIEFSSSKYVIYETDIRLLKKLLLGPKFAHWNNAEIGSHLKFYRKPDIFERDVYLSMCYFHS